MEEAEKVSKKLSVSFGIHNNWCYRKDRSVRKGGSGSEVYIGRIVILPLGIVSWKDGSVRTGDPDDVKLYTRRAVTHPLGMVNGVGDV